MSSPSFQPPIAHEPIAVMLSDRWGDPLDATDADAVAACARLAPNLVDEVSFVARGLDGGYGVLVELELPWHVSDDDEVVTAAWGTEIDDDGALRGAEAMATHLVHLAARRGIVAFGAVVTDPDAVYDGRIGVQCFIPERYAPLAPTLDREIAWLDPVSFV